LIELRSAWSLEVPDHAACRLLQRSIEGVDLRAALSEAALAFLGADLSVIKPHVGGRTSIYLPAGQGLFAATVVAASGGSGEKFLYARAGTWVHRSMLGADQVPPPRAVDADRSVAALLLP
jgi:hypothetical protein